MSRICEFVCTIEANPFNSPDYKIYGACIDNRKYSNIKLNKYGNVSIVGNMHDLGIGIQYNIKAEEQNGKYGYQYKVLNVKRERPKDEQSTRLFLSEILTHSQVNEIMKHYPDIIDRVMNNRLDDIDLNKLYDIGEYRFNVIKRKIVENFALSELIEEFKGLLDFQTLKKLYDKYASTIRIKQSLKDDPYKCLCGLSRIGFKTADGILLQLDKECKEMVEKGENPPVVFDFDLKTSKQREKAAILYLLEENESNGNTRIDVKKLKTECEKLAPACIQHFVDTIKNDIHIYYDKTSQTVSIYDTYETELYIRNRIIEGLKNNIEWDFDYKKYQVLDGISLTEQQLKAVMNICKYNISILNGFAGTGKTQSTKSIIRMLKDNNKTFILVSPTGRAAKVLKGYTLEETYTIHRGLGYQPPDEWSYSEKNKLREDVVVVDEASMTDVFLMRKLIEAIDFTRTKLLIIGDSAQIPSVGAGNILHDLVNSNIIPMTTLTQVFRYGSGGLMTVATKTRNSENFLNDENIQVFGDDKSYTFISTPQSKIIKNVCELYKKLLQKYEPEDILILSSYNKGEYGTIALNQQLQPIANENAKLNQNSIKFGDMAFYKDDLVIQTVNNYKAIPYNPNNTMCMFGDDENFTFIPNGEIGKIIEIQYDKVIIKFDDETIVYEKAELAQLKLAYSISLHKSQGGQAKVVILITPKSHTFMLNSNLIYVGQTRAKEKVYHFGEIETVNRAIKKKADFNRDTCLKSMLIAGNN